MRVLQYIIPAIISALSVIGGWAVKGLYARQKALGVEQSAIKGGMLALLHDRLYAIYGNCEKEKCASVETIRNADYLYQPYHALGGNGTGTELYNRIKDMPLAPPAEKEQNHE